MSKLRWRIDVFGFLCNVSWPLKAFCDISFPIRRHFVIVKTMAPLTAPFILILYYFPTSPFLHVCFLTLDFGVFNTFTFL